MFLATRQPDNGERWLLQIRTPPRKPKESVFSSIAGFIIDCIVPAVPLLLKYMLLQAWSFLSLQTGAAW